MSRRRGIRSVVLFRNEGPEAGASQEHSHSQILALPRVPPRLRQELARVERYRAKTGRCLTCDLLTREADGSRFIARNDAFVALTSFSPRYPYEAWIAPVAHAHDFVDTDAATVRSLAALLRQTLLAHERVIGTFPFNLLLQTAPIWATDECRSAFHWRLEIVPRVSVHSGLEIASDVFVVSTPPEEAARALRIAVAAGGRRE